LVNDLSIFKHVKVFNSYLVGWYIHLSSILDNLSLKKNTAVDLLYFVYAGMLLFDVLSVKHYLAKVLDGLRTNYRTSVLVAKWLKMLERLYILTFTILINVLDLIIYLTNAIEDCKDWYVTQLFVWRLVFYKILGQLLVEKLLVFVYKVPFVYMACIYLV
jgi:hypothetical protein